MGGLFYVTTSCTFLLIDKQSWRDVVKLVKTPAPSQQAAKVEVAGEYEDGVDFTHTYEFSPAGVSVLATIKDPQNEKLKKRPSNLTLIAHFPAVPGVLSTMPSDKIAEMTAGW